MDLFDIISFMLLAAASVVLVCSIWLFFWTRSIPRRSLKRVARQFGVSEEFAALAVTNYDELRAGRIDQQEFERRALALASRYPEDGAQLGRMISE